MTTEDTTPKRATRRKPKAEPAAAAAPSSPPVEPQRETAHELVELTPKQQALAAFKPQRDILAAFRKKFGPDVIVQYETREDGRLTTKGDAAARADRMELVTARTAIDKRRLALNEEDRQRIKERDEVAKSITNELAPYEEALQTLIKADEKKKEEERAEAERIKRERDERVANELNAIHNLLIASYGKSAAEIAAFEAELRVKEITEEAFGIRYGEAVSAKDHVLVKLGEAHAKAVELEERERRAAEAEARRKEEEAEAEARRKKAEDDERERQAQIAADNARRAAEIAKQEEELAARRKALDEEQEAQRVAKQKAEDEARAARLAKEEAERMRVKRIRDSIDTCFTRRPVAMANAGSVAISLALAEVRESPMEVHRFEEFLSEAKTAQALAIVELTKLLDLRKEQEQAAEQKRLADEAAAAARKKADDEAAAARKKADEEAAAERERLARAEAIERAKLARAQQAGPRLLAALKGAIANADFHETAEGDAARREALGAIADGELPELNEEATTA